MLTLIPQPSSSSTSSSHNKQSTSMARPTSVKRLLASAMLVASLTSPNFVSAFGYSYAGCFSSLSGYTQKDTKIYQSSQACSASCSGFSYFALTNGNECWCGNSPPSGSEGTCTVPCVGWAQEPCGSTSSFTIYKIVSNDMGSGSVQIGAAQPAGSDSSSSGGASASPSPSSSKSSSGDSQSKSASPDPATPSSASKPASQPSEQASTPSSAPPSTTSPASPDPSTSTAPPSTVTSLVNGQTTVLVTVSPTETESHLSASSSSAASATSSPSAGENKNGQSKGNSGISKGAIAGIVIGVVALIVIVAFTLLFLRRRQAMRGGSSFSNKYVAGSSSSHAFGDPFATRGYEEDKVSFGGPANGAGRATDDFMAVDQRLNPVMLGERRLSEGSLADDRDYSRKILRVANPDN